MSRDRSKLIRLGIFVLIALALFTLGIYNIGSKKSLFGSNTRIAAEFRDIKGLLAGNNVRYAGVTVGAVESVDIVNDTLIRVYMNISNDNTRYIKKNAVVSINSNGLVGDMIMNITPGRGHSSNIENGDILTSSQSIETQAMLSTLDQTNENFLQISDNLKAITDKMNAENGLISEILEDEAFSVDLKETVRNLNSMTRDLVDVSNELGKLVSDTKEGKGVLGYLLTDDEFGIKADDLLDNIDHQFIDRTGPVITDLQSITSSLNRTSTRIDSLVEAIDLDEGILGLLLKDQEAADQTEDLIDSIGVSVELFNENMEALRHNFLFKRYFKKKKKKEAKMLAQ